MYCVVVGLVGYGATVMPGFGPVSVTSAGWTLLLAFSAVSHCCALHTNAPAPCWISVEGVPPLLKSTTFFSSRFGSFGLSENARSVVAVAHARCPVAGSSIRT